MHLRVLLLCLVLSSAKWANTQDPTRDSECQYGDERRVRREDSIVQWLVTEEDDDIQQVLDCMEDGDVISLESSLKIHPSKRLVIGRAHVTIDGALNANDSHSTERTQFHCPEGDGLFVVKDCSFTLKNVVIKNCRLSTEHEIEGIIQTDDCGRRSSSNHKVQLSNVLFEDNVNKGGSVGVFIRDMTCHSEVDFDNVSFVNNTYTSPSSLSKTNSLTNVRMVANKWTLNGPTQGVFFHFPEGSITNVKYLTAENNRNAVVLNLSRGEMHILDSVFANNTGDNRGTIRVRSSSLIVRESLFSNNSCDCNGVAISAEDSLVNISTTVFSENDVGNFEGTVYVLYPRNVSFTSCTFTQNVMGNQGSGGTVHFSGYFENIPKEEEMTDLIEFKDCVFSKNMAVYGSAVYFSEINSQKILFESCRIKKNHALMPVNDTYVQSAIELHSCHTEEFVAKNCIFKCNDGVNGGALSFLQTTGNIQILGSDFEDNLAIRSGGGAVFLEGKDLNTGFRPTAEGSASRKQTTLLIDNSEFIMNTGEQSGGAVLVTGESVDVRLSKSRFLRNEAGDGAAVSVEDAHSLNASTCIFRNNHALYGAGGILSKRTPTVIWDCTFIENESQYGGAIEAVANIVIQKSVFSRNKAEVRGGAVNICYEEAGGYSEDCTAVFSNCTFRRNSAGRSGGAIHVYAENDLSIENSLFHKNSAIFGGGLSFFRVVEEGQWRMTNSTFAQNNASTGGAVSLMDIVDLKKHFNLVDKTLVSKGHSVDNESSSKLEIRNSSIWNNTAWSSGAGVFTEDPSLLKIDGESAKKRSKRRFNCQTMERPIHDLFNESTFLNNTVSGGSEENLASPSTGFCVFVIKSDHQNKFSFEDPNHELQEWKSGQDFPLLHVVMFDAFGNNFSLARNDRSPTKISFSSPENVYDEAVSVVLSSNTGTGSTLQFLKNRVYEDVSSGSGKITVGERYAKPGVYNLTLHVDGFNSQDITLEVHVRNCTINEESVQDGEFCKSCNLDQYSFDLNKTRCEACPDHADCRTNFTVPQEGYWNSFPCSHQMDRCAYKEACNFMEWQLLKEPNDTEMKCDFSESSIEEYQANQCANKYTGPLCGSCDTASGRLGSFSCEYCISTLLAVLGLIGILAFQLILAYLPIRETLHVENGRLEDRMKSLSVCPRTRKTLPQCRRHESFEHTFDIPSRRTTKPRPKMSTSSKVDKARKAKMRFLGTLKITINLLQTIAIASSLDVSWSGTAFTLFKAYDSVGGAVFIGSSFLLDCVLPSKTAIPRTVLRQIIVGLSPELVALLMSAFSFLMEPRTDRNWIMLLKRVILAHLVVAYHSYLTVVTTAVDAFNCAQVHDGIQLDDVETTHRYWIEDTSVKCYRGIHLTFTLSVSLPLMIFAIAFPVLLAVYLAHVRRQGRLHWKWPQETMGFLFCVFEEKYVYWDCLILLRKAALSIITVFGYRLGGNLQGLLALAVIAIAQCLQTHFSPFDHKLDRLNFLENVSLTVSFSTFLCGLILNDERLINATIKTIITAFLLCSNIGFFVVLIFSLVWLKLEQIRLEVETAMQMDCEEWKRYQIIMAYLKLKCALPGEQQANTDFNDGGEPSCQDDIEFSEF